MTREPIYQALFNLLRAAPGINFASRKLKAWSDTDPSMQPALYMVEEDEAAITTTGLPTRWTGFVELYIYARSADGCGPVLNPILDWVEAALGPNAVSDRQTLGGLVDHVRIDGQIAKHGGILGDQSIAIVPIRFLTA